METEAKKKVLYIEDERFFADTIQKILSAAGYSVVLVDDGSRALEVIRAEMPDAILLDLLLPNIDGRDILKLVKDDPAISGIPVIVFSNLSTEQDVEKTAKLGAVAYFVKALTMPHAVVDAVASVLHQKKAH